MRLTIDSMLSGLSLTLLMIVFILVSCGLASPERETDTPPIPISLQLGWVHDYSSVPFYAAEQNGYFAAQNLEVELLKGGFKEGAFINAIDEVFNGTADFGITDGYNLILARAEGKPLVAIAAILQRSPSAIISLQSSHIARPQDLAGKRVAMIAGGVTWTYNTMLASQDMTLDQIEVVPRTTFGIDPLINGEVDAMTGWIINEGVQVQEAGYEVNFIVMSDYGVDTYPSLIFTTEQMVTTQPDQVERFLRAVLAGMQETLAQPNQIVELVLMYDDTLDLDGQRRRLYAALPFLNPANSKPLMVQAEIWQATQQVLLNQGILDEPIDLEVAYTTSFLDKIYKE